MKDTKKLQLIIDGINNKSISSKEVIEISNKYRRLTFMEKKLVCMQIFDKKGRDLLNDLTEEDADVLNIL